MSTLRMAYEFTGQADERQLQRVAQAVAECLAAGEPMRVTAREEGWPSVQRVAQLVLAGPLAAEECRVTIRQRMLPHVANWAVYGWHRDGGYILFEPTRRLVHQGDEVAAQAPWHTPEQGGGGRG